MVKWKRVKIPLLPNNVGKRSRTTGSQHFCSIRLYTNFWLCLDCFCFKVDFWNSKVEFSVDFYYIDFFLMWFFYFISDLFYYNVQTIIPIFLLTPLTLTKKPYPLSPTTCHSTPGGVLSVVYIRVLWSWPPTKTLGHDVILRAIRKQRDRMVGSNGESG